MDYEEQKSFLRSYQGWCAVFLAPAAVFLAYGSFAEPSGRPAWVRCFWLLPLLASLIAVFYLPKYFRLTGDPAKKYRWTVRTTWILSPLAAIAAIALGQGRRGIAIYLLLAGAVMLTNLYPWQRLSLRPAYERLPDLAFAYLIGGGMLWTGFRTAGAGPVALAYFANFWLLWFVLNAEGNWVWLAIVGWAGFSAQMAAMGSSTGVLALCAGCLLLVFGAGWLSRLAEAHNRRNLDRTMSELAAFFGETREQSRQRAIRGAGQLAAEWRKARPEGADAIRRWYRNVSEIYVYAAAEFHLIYKHIAFILEILPLLRGRMLDFGAGIGDLCIAAAKRGCRVTHLDVPGRSQEFARWLAAREGTELVFANDLAELEGSFDTIVSLDVLEHVLNLEEVLDGLVQRLAPGGKMILGAFFGSTEPHPQHFAHQIDLKRFLAQCGLPDRKGLRRRLFGSEIMRKRGVLILENSKSALSNWV